MDSLRALIEKLECDPSLHETHRLRQRVDALDRLEPYLMDEHDEVRFGSAVIWTELRHRAKALQAELEADNRRLYRQVRRDIREGERDCLLRWVSELGEPRLADESADNERYDCLDDLVSGVLQLEEPDHHVVQPDKEMVFYQPTPARHVFDLIARAELAEHDVLVDLGSGLGHVPLLISICTPAKAIGIELHAAYVRCARRCAAALNQTRVSFIPRDVRTADFSMGTVFYLYTPFNGSILRAVLDSLQLESTRRQIRIHAFGPCVRAIAQERWLDAIGTIQTHRIALFRSRS